MAYEKQNFIDGLPLYASQLNHIEEWLSNIEKQIQDSSDSFVVAISGTSNGLTADRTVTEIYEAYQAGKHVYALHEELVGSLIYISNTVAAFSFLNFGGGGYEGTTIVITSNGVDIIYTNGALLPDVTEEDNGKIPMVVDGEWTLTDPESVLTDRTTGKKYKLYVDNGKLMMEEVS